MNGLFLAADDLLRGRGRFDPRAVAAAALPWWLLPAIILIFTPVYGAAMGCYELTDWGRLEQVLYSALKVPLLLGVTSLICLPGFFVMTSILGLREDFRRSLGAILAGQAAMAVVLAALAPLTGAFYLSTGDYAAAQLFNGLMFFLATLAAQVVMRRASRPLIEANPRHRITLAFWLVVYIFVGIQMGWTLRPFIGRPGAPTTFFRDGALTNAYVEVARIVAGVFGGQ